jgi:paraquat-inducible protein B
MSKKANPTLIGIFVVGAVALLVVVLLTISGGRLFRDTHQAVAYFEGTVRGLQVGSNVMFRGVPIGRVLDIRVVVDTRAVELSIPVVMELDRSMLDFDGDPGDTEKTFQRLDTLTERGLRAQLVVDSLVTGQVIVEFGFHPSTPVVYRAPPSNQLYEMPTIPSDLQVVMEKVEDLVGAVEEMPVEDIMAKLSSALDGLDRLLNSEELASIVEGLDTLINSEDTQQLTASLRGTLENLDTTLDDASGLLRNADAQVEPLMTNLNATLADVDLTLAEARGLLTRLQGMTSPDSELHFNANATLRQLENAMRSLSDFLEFLERNPEALVKGRRQP